MKLSAPKTKKKLSKQTPKAPMASETRYRRLFETTRDGIIIIDAVTKKIIDVNPFMVKFLGGSPENFLNKETWEIGLFRDQEEAAIIFQAILKFNHIEYENLALKTRSGERREAELAANIYTENEREFIQFNIRDITARRQADFELLESVERYRDLIENAHDIIYTHDLLGNYTSVNKAGERITGYTREESLNMNLQETVAPEYLGKARQMMAKKLAGEDVTAYDLEIVAKDGHRVSIEVNTRIICDDGVAIGVQGIARDISERKQFEDQLRQSEKLKSVGLLAGGIAHDFNNMLTAINGYSDLTLRRLKGDDPLRRNIEEIKKAGLRSADLTRQLLAFSRRQFLKPVVTNLNEVIADTAKMLQRLIGEDIQLTATLSPKLGQVIVDPGQFSQIIINLAVNGRDAMPQGGNLTIETANVFLDPIYCRQHVGVLPGAYVLLAVSDSGMGMSDEMKQHIFEPFFTTKEVGKGTGLGLATVYGIVKQSGGSIEVYSEEGIGTTFKIYLPRVIAEIDEMDVRDVYSEMTEGTETILLVEDEEMVRNLTGEILKTCGYKVIEAENGVEALSIYDRNCHIDLLMTDVVMPKMGGRELASELKKKLPDLQILFASGYTDDAIVRHGIIETNTNFIQKPFTPEILAAKIRDILDNPVHKI